MGMRPTTVCTIVSIATALGCSSTVPAPNDQWAAAQADVGRAQAGGAPDVPDARLHLQLAQEDLTRAKQVMGDDNRRASTLTELARAEAQLALSLAKEAASQYAARKALHDAEKNGGD
jgi:hypothetical protein